MNRYPGLFMELSDDGVALFEREAEKRFAEAGDVLEANAIWHPVYRRRLGELLIERAEAEMHDLVPEREEEGE